MMASRPVGVLTGLAFEARLARSLARQSDTPQPAPAIRCAAASAERAAEEAAALCREGLAGLLSFGIAGGLDPSLPAGSLILATEIRSVAGERIACDAAWLGRVEAKAAGYLTFRPAALAAGQSAVASPAAKATLFSETGAAAVDMESLAAARAASAAGIPFLALRAIADPAERGLPWAALAPLDGEGRPRPLRVMGRLAARPWELPALLRLGLEAKRAERALAGLGPIAAPLFGGL
jgi:adenosylhomocysteine nucleosidase